MTSLGQDLALLLARDYCHPPLPTGQREHARKVEASYVREEELRPNGCPPGAYRDVDAGRRAPLPFLAIVVTLDGCLLSPLGLTCMGKNAHGCLGS